MDVAAAAGGHIAPLVCHGYNDRAPMPKDAFTRFTRFMQAEFWLFLLGAIALAFLFPGFGRAYVKPLALPAILLQMYIVMLDIPPARLLAAFRAWRPLARGLGLIFVVTPLLAAAARPWFRPEYVLGLAVLSAMPSGMSAPFFAIQFGGDGALAVATTAVSHLLVPLVAPLVVQLVAGGVLAVDPAAIFLRLVELVVLPFAAAWLTRAVLGERRTLAVYRRVSWLAGFFVIIVTWGIVAEITAVDAPVGALAAAVAAGNGALFALGWAVGGAWRRTTTMTAGYRNVTLGMVLSLSVWGDPLVAAPSVVWTLTHTIFAVVLLFLHRRRPRSA